MQRVWRTVTGYYHVSARGTGKQTIFETDDDRWEFLGLLRDCCRDAGVTVVAWCLMVNRVDLVLADYEDKMSAAMQRVLITYARRFNKRTGRTGQLFQNRFDRRALDTDRHLMAAIRHVHANPQEAGICLLGSIRGAAFPSSYAPMTTRPLAASRTPRRCLTCSGPRVALSHIRWGRLPAMPRCFMTWRRRSGSDMRLPIGWQSGSACCLTSSRPSLLRSAMGLSLRCMKPGTPCVRSSGIRGLAKVPFLVSFAPARKRRCRLAESRTGRRMCGLCVRARYRKAGPPESGGPAIKNLGFGTTATG